MEFPEENEQSIKSVANNEIQKEQKYFPGFGSFRGYATNTRGSILKRIKIKLIERRSAMITLRCNININNWINHILYRPPTENNSPGLRYANIKKTFEEQQKNK